MIAEFQVETIELRSGYKDLRVRLERVPDGIEIRLHQTGPTVADSKPLGGLVLPDVVALKVAQAILEDPETLEKAASATEEPGLLASPDIFTGR